MSVIWLRQVNWRHMNPRTFSATFSERLLGLIFSGPLAAFVGIVVLGLLIYSFVISIGLPAAQRAAPLATIATGMALFAVAALAYKLQRQHFDALRKPSLGIHYKDPLRETATREKTDVYAEYIMWNAGDVPILIWKPQCPLPLGLGPVDPGKEPVDPVDPGKERVELERVRAGGGKRVFEESFPIVLGRGEVCIWRQFTGDVAPHRPLMSEMHDVSRENAREFLQKQQGNRRFLFEVVYFSKPPAVLRKRDVHRQYVAFSYIVPSADGEARHD